MTTRVVTEKSDSKACGQQANGSHNRQTTNLAVSERLIPGA
jgi:hypothetical protein